MYSLAIDSSQTIPVDMLLIEKNYIHFPENEMMPRPCVWSIAGRVLIDDQLKTISHTAYKHIVFFHYVVLSWWHPDYHNVGKKTILFFVIYMYFLTILANSITKSSFSGARNETVSGSTSRGTSRFQLRRMPRKPSAPFGVFRTSAAGCSSFSLLETFFTVDYWECHFFRVIWS